MYVLLSPDRSFDQHLEGVRQAEAAAARALIDQANNKNPLAMWLESVLGTDKNKAEKASGGAGRVAAVAAKSVPGGGVGDVEAGEEVAEGGGRSYFDSTIIAYALGLALCFAVNLISKSGQPGET